MGIPNFWLLQCIGNECYAQVIVLPAGFTGQHNSGSLSICVFSFLQVYLEQQTPPHWQKSVASAQTKRVD